MAVASLDELRRTILRYRRCIGKNAYTHHVVGLVLSQIAKAYGNAQANKAIRNCGLDELGWTSRYRSRHRFRTGKRPREA